MAPGRQGVCAAFLSHPGGMVLSDCDEIPLAEYLDGAVDGPDLEKDGEPQTKKHKEGRLWRGPGEEVPLAGRLGR